MTAPFSDEFVEQLKEATAWRFNSALGPVFTPRFFCCSDPNNLGIVDGKHPVAVIELSPNPCLVSDSVSFDGTDSYDPDGTVTGYAWTFESGTPASSSASSGTVSWAAAGEYEVTLIVTDGTGLKSPPARAVVVVEDPAGAYYLATENGVYYTDDGGQNWTAKNSGLSGDALKVNHIMIDPATQNLPESQKTIWIATNDGLYISNDGAAAWVKNSPTSISNIYGDTPAPSISDLDFINILIVGDFIFALANWTSGGNERGVVYQGESLSDARADTSAVLTWSEITDGYV